MNDIKPATGFNKWLILMQPRLIELSKLMGNYKQIPIRQVITVDYQPSEIRKYLTLNTYSGGVYKTVRPKKTVRVLWEVE